MKIRLMVALACFAIGFALPTFAQDTVDPQVAEQVRALASEYDQAFNKNDATALGAPKRSHLHLSKSPDVVMKIPSIACIHVWKSGMAISEIQAGFSSEPGGVKASQSALVETDQCFETRSGIVS
jgi:hypothetical protein